MRQLRVAVLGMSERPTSGMRDHATLLAGALAEHGIACRLHWLVRSSGSLAAERARVLPWARNLEGELRAERADAVLLHYASFAYAHRGIPLHLPAALRAASSARAPLLAFMHELAYPWSARDIRADVWASSQRVALIELMRRSSAAVVTMDRRERWLRSRRWLPRRPLASAPVFSNLPAAHAAVEPEPGLLGLFGYAYEGIRLDLVLDAVRLLRDRGLEVALVLLGSPGEDSADGRRWRAAAQARGVQEAVRFSGLLPAAQLADAIARCQLLLSAAWQGPTSSRGSIAASLRSGRALVALQGPREWPELAAEQAAMLVEPSAPALAGALARLLQDPALREAFGERAASFYERRMSLQRSAELTAGLLRQLVGAGPPAPP